MTLQEIVEAAEAAVVGAGGRNNSLDNAQRTAMAIQAAIVYTGLDKIAQNQIDIAAIGDSLTTMIGLLDTIKTALAAGQTIDLAPIIGELVLLRDAIHRS